jgi:methyltransferase (TIGR00027 family)
MIENAPSKTAYKVAYLRAQHQLVDHGRIFLDPLAIPILGMTSEMVSAAADTPAQVLFRSFIAARARLAEQLATSAIRERGAVQLVILGAGLDTLAYRGNFGDGIAVFEIDHPATQAWKRLQLENAGISAPRALTFVPVDFEKETVAEALRRTGFDFNRRTFVMWIGVVPYLSEPAIRSTFQQIAAIAGGAEVVFDYGEAPAALNPEQRAAFEQYAARVAALGEPFKSMFDPHYLHGILREQGFTEIVDLCFPDVLRRAGVDLGDPSTISARLNSGPHLVHAITY